MEVKDVLVGALVTAFVFGAYLLGGLHGQRGEFFGRLAEGLTWKGFVWATALPTCWLLLFYTFVMHVRLSLGQWPQFGQHLEGWAFAFYDQATHRVAWALISSFYAAPVFLVVCLFVRTWRHVSFYIAAYQVAVGIAFGAMFLAPNPFLTWYFD